ncbi:MAG TPA: SEC-C metal-binding domain-containing protein, partial [Burkholderiaceae bacterium]|nr:SEC-C metal-binding domain-containing protein [Burkholderiaceae bacterium]
MAYCSISAPAHQYSQPTNMTMSPGRNDPCPCGSGKKFKKCCADKLDAYPDTPNVQVKRDAPTPSECDQLLTLFNAGRHAEVESKAGILSGLYPNSGFVWKVLAGALQMQGKNALPAIQKATELMPNDAEAHSILGNALQEQGLFNQAVTSYRLALKIKPDFS